MGPSELVTMASKVGESSSSSSTVSIDISVLGSHESRSLSSQPEVNFETVLISSDSSQPEGNLETVFISSDSEPSGNSEATNRTETTQDPFCVNVASPLIFESQYTESSNVGTQSEEPSENSETTNRTETTQDPFCVNVASPLIF